MKPQYAILIILGYLINFESVFVSIPVTDKTNPSAAMQQTYNGAIAFSSNRDGQFEIYKINPDGNGLVNLTNNPAHDDQPNWSPDGKHLTFISDRDGNFEIYVMNADGTTQIRLTNNLTYDSSPFWSPDNKKIAFISRQDDDYHSEIYVIESDGTNLIQLSNAPDFFNEFPAWSPDGQSIAFTSRQGFYQEINIVQADGTGLRNISQIGTKPNWSPDGQQIVFEGTTEEHDNIFTQDIYKVDVDGSNLMNLADHSVSDFYVSPSWSPDGQYIAFLGWIYGENEANLYTMKADGSEITFHFKEPDILRIHETWAWSPDSKRIAFSLGSPIHAPYGEIYLMDLKTNEALKIIENPEINYHMSWQSVSSETQSSKSPLPTLGYSFYIFGCLITCVGAITTTILLLWVANQKGRLPSLGKRNNTSN